ncbi:rab-like protein 3 isoform X2 [Halichondria panicea]
MAAENLRKVKILVLGDTGVGKTSLVHLICHGEVLSSLSWTIGCSVDVKLHDFGPSTSTSSSYFLELWDVGGSPSHKRGRQIFYQNANGLILVHDLTNRKSHSHLSKWLNEFHQSQSRSGKPFNLDTTLSLDPELFADQEIPVLIVGTKKDLVKISSGKPSTGSSLTGAACVNVDCTDVRQFSVDSQENVQLNKFFDKVLERRFLSSTPSPSIPGYS